MALHLNIFLDGDGLIVSINHGLINQVLLMKTWLAKHFVCCRVDVLGRILHA